MGGTTHRAAQRVRAVGRIWDEGDFPGAVEQARTKRAEKRSGVSKQTLAKLFRRATQFGRQGKISRMCAAFTAADKLCKIADLIKSNFHQTKISSVRKKVRLKLFAF
jgi:hypothetical protein